MIQRISEGAYLYFIDYSNALDYVDQEKLLVVLKETGMPQHSIGLIFKLHYGQKVKIRAKLGETK